MPSTRKVNIGLVQMSGTNNKEVNIKKATEQIRIAAANGANIVCLQELFATMYFCDKEDSANFLMAETLNGYTIEYMQQVAIETSVVIIASIFEKRAPGLFHNTTVVINDDGSVLGYYRKNHIPDDPGFYEKYYFAQGDTGYKVFNTKYANIGVLICWDQWYPEAARIISIMGAEIIFYPTAIGWEPHEKDEVKAEQFQAWQTIQRSHAIANCVPVVSVNRVGREADTIFWGGSFVTNPFGTILYQAPFDREETFVQRIDLAQTDHYRTVWPFIRDRRVDTYEPILQRWVDKKND